MTEFEQYLLSIGYVPYKELYDKSKKNYYYVEITAKEASYFSTLSDGRLFNIWKKQGKVDVVFGLDEKGKPPTLISPNPIGNYGILENDETLTPNDRMNRLIKSVSSEELYNLIIKHDTA